MSKPSVVAVAALDSSESAADPSIREGGAVCRETTPSARIIALFTTVSLFGAERSNLEVLRLQRDRGATVLLLAPDVPWGQGIRKFMTALGFDFIEAPALLLPRGGIGSWLAALRVIVAVWGI